MQWSYHKYSEVCFWNRHVFTLHLEDLCCFYTFPMLTPEGHTMVEFWISPEGSPEPRITHDAYTMASNHTRSKLKKNSNLLPKDPRTTNECSEGITNDRRMTHEETSAHDGHTKDTWRLYLRNATSVSYLLMLWRQYLTCCRPGGDAGLTSFNDIAARASACVILT